MNRRSFMGMTAAVAVMGTAVKPTTQRVEVERNGRWVEIPEGLRVVNQGDHFRCWIRDPETLWSEGIALENGTLSRGPRGEVCGGVEADLTVENGEPVNG